jgi:hypothetical protein
MNEFTPQEMLITGTIITLILAEGGYYFFTKQKSPKINTKENENNALKDEISKKLNILENDFLDIAKAYYLELRLLESDLSTEKQKEILKNYAEVLSEPKIEWNNFIIINEEGTLLNKLLEEKIKTYHDKDNYTTKASFNYMLLDQAKEEAKKIIKKEEQKSF